MEAVAGDMRGIRPILQHHQMASLAAWQPAREGGV